MTKVFITGGAGYVGAVLTPYLLDKGYEVKVLDLMIYGEKVLQEHKNLKILKGDIRDLKLIERESKKCDVFIHLACISNDPSFELNPKLGKSINLDAFEPIVKIAKKNSISRFIYASSSSVYGVKKAQNVNEEMNLEPITDYSRFKADCEKILLKYLSKDFIPIIIRPATVCGYSPRQRLDVVVNILTNLAFHKKEISVFGGDQLRPNIHIHDMVRAYISLIEAEKKLVSGQIFNAGFENQTVNELALLVKKVIGDNVKIKKIKSNDDRSYHISSKKIEKILGFKAEKTIEDAVIELKNAFVTKKLNDTLSNEFYFNIKRMNNINLK
jgi:nucleoside-diphosphate-sugar epimerase